MKNVINHLNVSRFLHVYDAAAARKGINISLGFDFHEYLSITRAIPTKGTTYPIFRPDTSSIGPGEGYWVIGTDRNNDVALVEAARLYDLSHSNFAEHLESLKVFYSDPSEQAHPEDRCICTALSARKITGKVAYHGDIWVRRDFRGKGVAKIMTGMARGVSFAMWAPDFVCGLAGRWSVEKDVYDTWHCEPGGSILRLVEENIIDDDWLLWATGAELRSFVDRQHRSDVSL